MRLWSLHPAVLDRVALIAGWREGLLAQAVLAGRTRGYRQHPQLERFRAASEPDVAIATWLAALADEAEGRSYRFDRNKIEALPAPGLRLEVTTGQLDFEYRHLLAKVSGRAPEWLPRLAAAVPHPLFRVVPGAVAAWEKAPEPAALVPVRLPS